MLGGGSWTGGSGGSVGDRVTVLEAKRVRTRRFATINSGTTGTVTLPSNATVVLNDFGGTLDAITCEIASGSPSFTTPTTAGGALITTTFNSSGDYVLSGTPSAYPIGIIYCVYQTLINFDSTASDIVGDPDFSGAASVITATITDGDTTHCPDGNSVFDALALKAPLASPTFTGTPASVTASASNNSTQIATTAYVDNQALLPTSISNTARFYDDFWGVNGMWVVNTSGTGSISNIRAAKSTPSHPGVWALRTGTTTTGYANIIATNQDEVFAIGGAGVTTFEIISLMDALSNGTDTYTVMAGVRSTAYANDMAPAAGIYFTYTHGTNSGNWTLICRNASTSSSVDMGTGPTAGTFQRLSWVMNAAGTSVQGYIDGVAAGSAITTNIPTTTTKMMCSVMIAKSAGTTDVYYAIDAIALTVNFTTPR